MLQRQLNKEKNFFLSLRGSNPGPQFQLHCPLPIVPTCQSAYCFSLAYVNVLLSSPGFVLFLGYFILCFLQFYVY